MTGFTDGRKVLGAAHLRRASAASIRPRKEADVRIRYAILLLGLVCVVTPGPIVASPNASPVAGYRVGDPTEPSEGAFQGDPDEPDPSRTHLRRIGDPTQPADGGEILKALWSVLRSL